MDEILYTNLDEVFGEADDFTTKQLKKKWRVLEIGTSEFNGKMLMANIGASPSDISFNPKLTGWYKIYLAIPFMFPNNCPEVTLKLSSDDTYSTVAPTPFGLSPVRWMTMHECLWKCADLSGESITLSRKNGSIDCIFALSAIRFVKMSEEEIARYKAEQDRTKTKNCYATDDMHNILFLRDELKKVDDFRTLVSAYKGSDVEWLSVEDIRYLGDNIPIEEIDDYTFYRAGDKRVHERLAQFDWNEVYKKVVEWGHADSLKVSVSLRMGAWGYLAPLDDYYFENDFIKSNPDLRCQDRNGDYINAMSYAYPAVQDHIIDMLVRSASSGCDAVTLISIRGIPYLLFEKPVAERFYKKHGFYPYDLPLDEPRLNEIHTQIMSEFFQKLRNALDEKFGQNKVEIHLRSPFSLYDSKILGFDCSALAKKGLVNRFISYPLRCYETFNGDVWKDEKNHLIDLDKYTKHVRTQIRSVMRIMDFDFIPPYEHYSGEKRGPISQAERVAEWRNLEKEYGVKVYYEIMPRHMTDEELKRRVIEYYELGADNFALWDSFHRAIYKGMWHLMRRIGDKQNIKDMEVGEGEYYRNYVIYSIGGKDFSRYDPVWGG